MPPVTNRSMYAEQFTGWHGRQHPGIQWVKLRGVLHGGVHSTLTFQCRPEFRLSASDAWIVRLPFDFETYYIHIRRPLSSTHKLHTWRNRGVWKFVVFEKLFLFRSDFIKNYNHWILLNKDINGVSCYCLAAPYLQLTRHQIGLYCDQ